MTPDEAVKIAEFWVERYKNDELGEALRVLLAERERLLGGGMGGALPGDSCSAIEHKALREENERLRDQVENLLHRVTSEEVAVEIELAVEIERLREALGTLVGLARVSGGKLHQYEAALRIAESALAGKAQP